MPAKMMTNIGCTPADFHVIDVLPEGNKFNAHLYVSLVMQSFVHWRLGEVEATDQTLIVQADNARLYKSMMSLAFIGPNAMKNTSYRAYSQIWLLRPSFFSARSRGFSVVTLSNQPMIFGQRFRSSWYS
jgi:hypothetical protein